jgi:hypothetical protein
MEEYVSIVIAEDEDKRYSENGWEWAKRDIHVIPYINYILLNNPFGIVDGV